MPISPLIRPLSPLQTQRAPPLPDPYTLADVPLDTNFLVTQENGNAFYRMSVSPQRSDSVRHHSNEQCTSASPSSSPAPPRAAASTLCEPVMHKNVSAEAGRNRQTTVPVSPEHTYHTNERVTQLGSAVQLMNEDGVRSRALKGFISQPPKSLVPTTLFSLTSSPVTTATVPDAAAKSSTYSLAHPYAKAGTSSPPFYIDPRNYKSRRHAVSQAPSTHHPSVFPSPTAVDASASNTTDLLHASTASVAVAASHPSYGTKLLRNTSPLARYRNFERQCRSPPPTAPLYSVGIESFITPYDEPAEKHFDTTREGSNIVACIGRTAATDAAELPTSNCYRGTAVSSRTGRLYNIAIEASLLDKDTQLNRVTASSYEDGGEDARRGKKITSALYEKRKERGSISESVEADSEEVKTSPRAAETDLADEMDRACCSCHGSNLENSRVDKVGKHKELQRHIQRNKSPPLSGTSSPASHSMSPQSAIEKAVTAPESPLLASAVLSYPRYVYPALDECQRLLQEIQRHNPLMRRCLTPPRPLLVTNWFAGEKEYSSPDAAAAAAATEVLIPDNCAPAATKGSVKKSEEKEKVGRLGPGPDVRRLYHWDAVTAAADLSYMHGPFQQSSERFATSTVRQLRRLRETGTRFYGTEGGIGKYSSLGPLINPRRFLEEAPFHFTDPASHPREVLNQTDQPLSGRDDVAWFEVESPSGRLRRLLRETEAAFPVLWRSTHMHATAASSSHSEESEQSVSGSGFNVFNTPSPSAIQLSRGEKDGECREYDEASFVKEAKGDFTLSRFNCAVSLSSEELGLKLSVPSLTPPRPLPQSLHSAGTPLLVPQRAD